MAEQLAGFSLFEINYAARYIVLSKIDAIFTGKQANYSECIVNVSVISGHDSDITGHGLPSLFVPLIKLFLRINFTLILIEHLDSNGIVEHELPFAVLAKKIFIFPYDWKNWICMRIELYGVYMTDNMCASAGQEAPLTKECQGDRNCSLNADCKPMMNDSIIKTGKYWVLGILQPFRKISY